MDCLCVKFGYFSSNCFGFIVQTYAHKDAANRFTPVTIVSVSNECIVSLGLQHNDERLAWLKAFLTDTDTLT